MIRPTFGWKSTAELPLDSPVNLLFILRSIKGTQYEKLCDVELSVSLWKQHERIKERLTNSFLIELSALQKETLTILRPKCSTLFSNVELKATDTFGIFQNSRAAYLVIN